MDRDDLDAFRRWFRKYLRSFAFPDPEDRRNIDLKAAHTARVCANARRIGRGIGLNHRDLLLAEAAALFHDIGRFRQYEQYCTFRDSASINHAVLGAAILAEEGVIRSLPESEQGAITKAVELHNALTLPEIADAVTMLLLRLVRDADKLDIWRVFAEYHETPPPERPSAAGLGLPDRPVCSPRVIGALLGRRVAAYADVETMHDFTLLQLSWVFDLNFPATFALLRERGLVRRLSETLPETAGVRQALRAVENFLELRGS